LSDRPNPMTARTSAKRAGAFDIRSIIALLLGIYGVVLAVTGVVGTSTTDLAKSDGVNVNLWTGLALLLAAAAFLVWARLRPVLVPEGSTASDEKDPA
jgi:drug/metabolite transporter (DMT)-like permease